MLRLLELKNRENQRIIYPPTLKRTEVHQIVVLQRLSMCQRNLGAQHCESVLYELKHGANQYPSGHSVWPH